MGFARAVCRKGFTIIELLAVIAVIAVLAGIVLRVRDGARERAQRDRAEGELAAMAQALEAYRATFGDYPWGQGDDALVLARALQGDILPDGRAPREVRPLLDLQRFVFGDPETLEPFPADASPSRAVLLDPWGQPYRYRYRSDKDDAAWQRRGYVLLSTGPSGARATEEGRREAPGIPADGLIGDAYFNADSDASPTYDNVLAQP